jgi:hypothetical protein
MRACVWPRARTHTNKRAQPKGSAIQFIRLFACSLLRCVLGYLPTFVPAASAIWQTHIRADGREEYKSQ